MARSDDNTGQTLRSVDTAIDILQSLAASARPIGVRELARAVRVSKSMASRIILTLEQRGMLRQVPDTLQYTLGARVMEIAAGYRRGLDLRRLALPCMEALSEAAGESVYLGVLDDTEVVVVERVDAANALRLVTEPGAREPAFATGLGKVLLGGLAPAERGQLVARLAFQPFTANTASGADALLRRVAEAAERGYAVDDEEYRVGARCVAAPVRNHDDKVVAALSIAGPTIRMVDVRLPGLVQLVTGAAASLSQQLGHVCDIDQLPMLRTATGG